MPLPTQFSKGALRTILIAAVLVLAATSAAKAVVADSGDGTATSTAATSTDATDTANTTTASSTQTDTSSATTTDTFPDQSMDTGTSTPVNCTMAYDAGFVSTSTDPNNPNQIDTSESWVECKDDAGNTYTFPLSQAEYANLAAPGAGMPQEVLGNEATGTMQ